MICISENDNGKDREWVEETEGVEIEKDGKKGDRKGWHKRKMRERDGEKEGERERERE